MRTLLLILLASALSGTQLHSQPIEKKIDSLLQTYYTPGGPGVALSIIQDGKIIYSKQVGYANLEYNIPITDSTAFHIASVSKQFTAFAALLLEKEGKLSMDDDIRKYLPELKKLPYTVTIRQLCNHTHGLANTYELAQLIGISSQEVMTNKKMIDILLRQEQLNFEPGTQYQYNNTGFALLAEIVHRITGKTFAEFAKERIFTPLAMTHTLVLDDGTTIVKDKAYSYRKTKQGYYKVPFSFDVIGGSGINTTAHDLSLWAMNFDNPKIGDKQIFDKMKTPSHLKNGQQIPYALGQETKQYKGLDVIFHGGGDAGYRAYLLRIPAHKFSVVIMGNTQSFNPSDLPYDIVDVYLKQYETPTVEKKLPHYTTKDLLHWQGDYEFMPGTFFTLVAKNDSLYYQPFRTAETYPLPLAEDSTFTFPYTAKSKMVFTPKGLVWHFSDFAYPCKKVQLTLPDKSTINLDKFAGTYWNETLRTTYSLVVKDSQLIATHALNNDIILHPLAQDEFYSEQSFFGRIKFTRNKENKITGFSLKGQNLNDIPFVKLNK